MCLAVAIFVVVDDNVLQTTQKDKLIKIWLVNHFRSIELFPAVLRKVVGDGDFEMPFDGSTILF